MLGNSTVMFWLSEHGIVMSDGSSIARISDPIRSVIDSLLSTDRQGAVGFFARGSYYISFPALGQTFGYYAATGEWFGPLMYATSSAYYVMSNPNTFNGQSTVNEVTAIRQNTAYIDQWFTGGDLDLGASQAVTWQGSLMDSGEPHKEKLYKAVSINAPVQPGKFATVTLTIDPGSNPPKVKTWKFDLGKGPVQTGTVSQDFRGGQAQLTVQFST
jgi:hypothetical protein